MESKDDPEARIRELERSLTEQARTSELGGKGYEPGGGQYGYVAPPPVSYGPTYPPPATSFGSAYPPVSGSYGGLQYTISGTGRRLGWMMFAITTVVGIAIAGSLFLAFDKTGFMGPQGLTVSSGGNVSVSGSNETQTVVCDGGGDVSVSGFTNTVTITGHCADLAVSGFENKVVVDSSDEITASGFGNTVTYHFGEPRINKSGDSVVSHG
ncbi:MULTISPECIES: DUF3060 domain-containing protein [unclassified Mycobacterium]|uniref:DUF3060 domain-containing protein n=1 Tax=unclassified Mycobacterium TaxID=2642494 RepID=UPI0029C6101D|nr:MULTISPECIES: DUF3060 domain-containing protein [unclassified Mycobacterium]